MFLAGVSACAEVLGWGRVGGFKERQGGPGSWSTVRWGWSGGWLLLPPLLCHCHSPGLSWPFREHCRAPCWASTSTPAWWVCSHSHWKDPVNNHVSSRPFCAQHHPWLPSHWEKSQSSHLARRPCRVWPHSSLPSSPVLPSPSSSHTGFPLEFSLTSAPSQELGRQNTGPSIPEAHLHLHIHCCEWRAGQLWLEWD